MNKICLLGLGYIGLPTGSMFALAGNNVVGVDPSPRVHAALSSGLASIDEPELQTLVTAAINSGRLRVETQPEVADAFIIAVPTPLDPATNRADLTFVAQAARDIVPFLRRGNLVELEQNDRLAGGLTPVCADRAANLYRTFVKGAIMRTDATTAEMVKVMENTFRDVNVALANEFALIAERIGVDVWDAIRLANHHPRVNVLRPGPGVGGHCIAVDPWFLVGSAPGATRLIQAAREVNDAMPEHVVARLATLVAPRAAVALLGVTYKAEIDDVRESPALRVAELAVEQGFAVRLCDPHVKADTPGLPAPLLPLEQALRDAEAVVLLVDHRAFKELDVDLA